MEREAEDEGGPQPSRGLVVGLLLALGLAVRLPGLASGLWLEECLTVYQVAGLGSVFSLNEGGTWLYPLMVWLSTSLLGLSEATLRIPSLLAGAALAPVTYLLLYRRYGVKVALFPALMAAFNPFSLHYSQEAQAHSAAMLVFLLWFGWLWCLLYETRGSFVKWGFVVLSPVLGWIDPSGPLMAFAGAVVAGLRLSSEPGRRQRLAAPLVGALALALASGLPQTLGQPPRLLPGQSADVAFRSALAMTLNGYLSAGWLTTASVVAGAALLILAFGYSSDRPLWAWGAGQGFFLLFLVMAIGAGWSAPGPFPGAAVLGLSLVTLGLAVAQIPRPYLSGGLIVVLLLSQMLGCARYWLSATPKSACRNMAEFIAAEGVEIAVVTLPGGFDPLYLTPVRYYLDGTEIGVLEYPRFREVPAAWISPLTYYQDFSRTPTPPQAEALEKLRALIVERGAVAVVGREVELQSLSSVTQEYLSKAAQFSGYNEGTAAVLILRQDS